MPNIFEGLSRDILTVVDHVLAAEPKTKILERGENAIEYDIRDAARVRIYTMLTDGLGDYIAANHAATAAQPGYAHYNGDNYTGARDGFGRGSAKGYWQAFTLRYLRGKQFIIDEVDESDSGRMALATLIVEFAKTKVVPEIDIVRLAAIADATDTGIGNKVAGAVADNTALAALNTGIAYINSVLGSTDNCVVFVNNTFAGKLRSTNEFNKYVSQVDLSTVKGINFTVPAYNGMPIIEVPNSRMYTDPVIDDENGFHQSATSVDIDFEIVYLPSVYPVVKINDLRIYGPEVNTDFRGYKANHLLRHDCFIPEQGAAGLYVHVSNALSGTGLLGLKLVAGDASGQTKLVSWQTRPAGLLGSIVYNESANFTVGTTYTVSGNIKAVEKGANFSLTGTTAYFAILDKAGKCLAISGQLTPAKK